MSKFENDVRKVLDGIYDTLVQRHHKYGEGNISRHGMLGLVVRLGDKLARLENGLESHKDESLEDTLTDIAGYAVIGLMWERGLWPGSGKKPVQDRRYRVNDGHLEYWIDGKLAGVEELVGSVPNDRIKEWLDYNGYVEFHGEPS